MSNVSLTFHISVCILIKEGYKNTYIFYRSGAEKNNVLGVSHLLYKMIDGVNIFFCHPIW